MRILCSAAGSNQLVDPVAAIVDEIIAEIGQLERENQRLHRARTLDDVFGCVNVCDNFTQDPLVAEFGPNFQNFDILKYVDPALDPLPDAGMANILSPVDSCMQGNQPVHRPADVVNAPNGIFSSHSQAVVQETMTVRESELQWYRSHVQQQQELIAEMQKQLNSLKANQVNAVVEQQHQHKPLEVDQVSTVTEMSTQVRPSQNVDHDTVKEARDIASLRSKERSENESLKNRPTHALECDQIIGAISEEFEVNAEPPRYSEPKLKLSKGSVRKKQDRLNHQRKKNLDVRKASKSHSCNECGRFCSSKSALTRHLRIHTGEKPYECKVCGRFFSQSTSLTTHLRIHNGEKPYECKACGSSFSQSTSLNTHLRIHNGDKPYECKVCGRSFSQSTSLTTHLRIHTGEKSFVCDICNSSFRLKHHLVRHFKVHTGEHLHKCNECQKSFMYISHLLSHRALHK